MAPSGGKRIGLADLLAQAPPGPAPPAFAGPPPGMSPERPPTIMEGVAKKLFPRKRAGAGSRKGGRKVKG